MLSLEGQIDLAIYDLMLSADVAGYHEGLYALDPDARDEIYEYRRAEHEGTVRGARFRALELALAPEVP